MKSAADLSGWPFALHGASASAFSYEGHGREAAPKSTTFEGGFCLGGGGGASKPAPSNSATVTVRPGVECRTRGAWSCF